MLQHPELQRTFKKLGSDWVLSDDCFNGLQQFTCYLYGQPQCSLVNDARFVLFRTTTTSQDSVLPPNRDCLMQHAKRANYQSCIHRHALDAKIKPPSIVDHGWKFEGSNLSCQWMTQPPAPEEILRQVHCRCKKSTCKNQQCSCRKSNVVCTDFCDCVDCSNTVDSEGESESDTSDDEVWKSSMWVSKPDTERDNVFYWENCMNVTYYVLYIKGFTDRLLRNV
jgi:hypothetical protein